METALSYFRQAGNIDLANNMGNASGGIHIAAAGSLWQQVIMGFAGVRFRKEGIFLYPNLPSQWKRLAFSLLWRGFRLSFDIKREEKIVLVAQGIGQLEVGIFGKPLQKILPAKNYVAHWKENAWIEFG